MNLTDRKESYNNYFKNFKKMPIIKKSRNHSLYNNNIVDLVNDENKRFYINTENNIFKDNYAIRKNDLKKYNLKNYKNLINNRRHFNNPSYEEQSEANIIKTFFDSLKLRTIKKELHMVYMQSQCWWLLFIGLLWGVYVQSWLWKWCSD